MSISIGSSRPQAWAKHPIRPWVDRRPKCVCSASSEAATNGNGAGTPGAVENYVQLGNSPLTVSSVGVGTLAWGDPGQGYGQRFNEKDIEAICKTAQSAGINFYDTAEVYGYQNTDKDASSECLVRRNAETAAPEGHEVVIGSKYFTIPWTNFLLGGGFRFGAQSMHDALEASLKRLGTDSVDLYQIHFPFPSYSQEVLMTGLREAFDSGKAKAVGVCNYDARQMEEMHGLLAKHDIPLACNQIEYSLLKRDAELSGLLGKCKDLGVTPVAHSPLAQGLLTDFALEREDAKVKEVKPLLQLLQFIGAVSGGKAIEQVALNYLICNGAVVIPGSKSVGQMERNAGGMGWRMDDNEVEIIRERLVAMKK